MAKPNCAPETAAHLAGRILVAWKSGPQGVLERELAYAACACGLDRHEALDDTLEMEKMDLLEGAAQSLRHGRQGQIQAAVYVLEHLARTGVRQ